LRLHPHGGHTAKVSHQIFTGRPDITKLFMVLPLRRHIAVLTPPLPLPNSPSDKDVSARYLVSVGK